MKLIKAEINGFGHFQKQMFSFEDGNQLYFGRNEVGKSTLYQFIQAMLFGFPKKRSRKRDYTPKDGAAYGGKLWIELQPYGQVRVERFRQVDRGKAKVFLGEQEGDEKLLAKLLAPLNETIFQEVFTFQQEQLSQIDHLQENELHAALISLGISGSKQLMGKIQTYQKENRQLFKPKGQRLPLNKRLNEYRELEQTIAEKESQEAMIKQSYQALLEKKKQQKQLEDQQRELESKQQLLNQQKINWSLYEEWKKLRTINKSRITEEEQQLLRAFYQEYQRISEEIQKKSAELARLEQGQESDRYFFFLDQEAKITEILRQKVTVLRRQDEIKRLEEREEHWNKELKLAYQKWGWKKEQIPQSMGEQVYLQIDRIEALEKQKENQTLRLKWLEEKRQPLENEVDRLENKYPELLQKKKKKHYPLLFFTGFVAYFLASFLFKLPIKTSLWGFGFILAVCIGIFYFSKSKNNFSKIKLAWQEKLLQLDTFGQEEAQENEKLTEIIKEQQEKVHQLQPAFGANENYLTWRKIVQEYDEETLAFQKAQREKQELLKQLEKQKEQQQTFERNLEIFSDWLPFASKTVVEKLNLIEEFAEKMQAKKMMRLQQPSTLIAQQLKQLRSQREQLVEEKDLLLKKAGIQHPSEIPVWIRQWEQHLKQVVRKKELSKTIDSLFPNEITWEELIIQIEETSQRQNQLHQKMNGLLEEKQRIQLQVEQMQKDGTLDELYQEKSRLLSEIHDLALTWTSNQILSSFLTDLATELSEQQLPQLLAQASYYFNILTDNRYLHVSLDQGILQVTDKNETLAIYSLSTGTKDQLIMAIRFAYLSLQEQALSPVIIDDGWLHYDAQRKKKLALLFREFGKKYQVICLSSDQEMVSYYQGLNQPVQEIKQRK